MVEIRFSALKLTYRILSVVLPSRLIQHLWVPDTYVVGSKVILNVGGIERAPSNCSIKNLLIVNLISDFSVGTAPVCRVSARS